MSVEGQLVTMEIPLSEEDIARSAWTRQKLWVRLSSLWRWVADEKISRDRIGPYGDTIRIAGDIRQLDEDIDDIDDIDDRTPLTQATRSQRRPHGRNFELPSFGAPDDGLEDSATSLFPSPHDTQDDEVVRAFYHRISMHGRQFLRPTLERDDDMPLPEDEAVVAAVFPPLEIHQPTAIPSIERPSDDTTTTAGDVYGGGNQLGSRPFPTPTQLFVRAPAQKNDKRSPPALHYARKRSVPPMDSHVQLPHADVRLPHRILTRHRSKWDHAEPVLQPTCNPKWLLHVQRSLPWFSETVRAGAGPWLSARAWEVPYRFVATEVRWRWQHRSDRWLMCIRLGLTALLIISLFVTNIILQRTLYSVAGVTSIYDRFHAITTRANTWLHTDPYAFNVIVLISSFCMDLVFLLVWFQWATLGDSFRLPIAYILLYSVRAFMRSICILPFPPGYIWHAPTFGSVQILSLTVPYQPSDDFFYSGHVGCSVLASIEHYYYRCWWGMFFSAAVACMQFMVLTMTRGHYAVDMFIGAIMAHWVHLVARKAARPIDQWLALPPRPVLLPLDLEAQVSFTASRRPVETTTGLSPAAQACVDAASDDAHDSPSCSGGQHPTQATPHARPIPRAETAPSL